MNTRVLIVGGGFVGLMTARLLVKRGLRNQVVLVSDQDRFVFTPWLVDLLGGDVKLDDMTEPLYQIAERDGFTFIKGRTTHLDRKKQIALVKTEGGEKKIGFDAVALCHGASTNFFGVPGADTNAFQIKTPQHVEKLKAKLDSIPESVTVCVIGAGPTGVETAFAVRDHLQHAGKTAKISLIQAAPRILPGFSESLVMKVKRYLMEANVMVMEGDPVVEVERDGVRLKSGSRMACHLAIWAGGIKPNQVDTQPSLPNDPAGCISVDRTLKADEMVFAAGDVCGILNPGIAAPKTAQSAMEMAPKLTENILFALNGQPLKPYTHHSKGTIITAGHMGLIELGWKFSLASPLLYKLRNVFYRSRFQKMTGR